MLVRPPASFATELLIQEGGSATDLSVNGSVTPVEFAYTVPADKIFYLARILGVMVDNSITGVKFAGISALTNGLDLEAKAGTSVLFDFLGGTTVKKNSDWTLIAGVDMNVGPQADFLGIRYTVTNAGAFMRFNAGQKIVMTVSDNLSAITEIRFSVQGLIAPSNTPDSLIQQS